MSTNRLMPWILLGALFIGASSTARAQDTDDLQFFAPAEITSYGGGYPRQRQGWFGSVDYLSLSIAAPDVTDIGTPGGSAIVPSGEFGGGFPASFPDVLPSFFPTERGRLSTNTIDTSDFKGSFASGTRVEFGNVDGHWGWMVGINVIKPQVNTITAGDVDVIFGDSFVVQPFVDLETGLLSLRPVGLLDGFINTGVLDTVDDTSFDILLPGPTAFGRFFDGNLDGVVDPTDIADVLPEGFQDLDDLVRLPVVFQEIRVRNVVDIKSVELMPFYRLDQLHGGGNVEIGVGLRYTKFDEEFDVQGFGGVLDDSNWNTRAQNNIFGPQAMARWSKSIGRFNLSAEGRGFLGINFQNINQNGTIAGFIDDRVIPGPITSRNNNLPAILNATSFNNALSTEEFSPLVELRAQVSYSVTKAIALRAGWTGSWQDGLARPSTMVNYQVPSMGILGSQNSQRLFINGYTFGVEINR